MIDVLSIIVNSSWQTQQVGYHFTRVIVVSGATQIWEMKDKSGWPADVLLVDDKYVYFYVTEADGALRNDPRSFKKCIGAGGLKGWPAIPRYINACPVYPLYGKRVGDTTFEFWQNCLKTGQSGLGLLEYTFDGPFLISWGGDLGDCKTYVLNYVYNSGKSRERFYFAMRPNGGSYGWVGWDVAQNGVIAQTSYRNKLVSVIPPVPSNPCKL